MRSCRFFGLVRGSEQRASSRRHEAEIGVRFAGLDELIDLVQCGEVVQRLGRDWRQGATVGQ